MHDELAERDELPDARAVERRAFFWERDCLGSACGNIFSRRRTRVLGDTSFTDRDDTHGTSERNQVNTCARGEVRTSKMCYSVWLIALYLL